MFHLKLKRWTKMAKKILVVDDDEDSLNLVSKALQYAGYDIVKASDGEQTISQYEEQKPDLVLLDVRMPTMDGYEAFFKIKEIHKDAKVIFMTAYAVDEKIHQRAKELNLTYLLMKPFSLKFLKELIADVLK